jgi:hypothetical protein
MTEEREDAGHGAWLAQHLRERQAGKHAGLLIALGVIRESEPEPEPDAGEGEQPEPPRDAA